MHGAQHAGKRREMDLMKLMMSDWKVDLVNDCVNEFNVLFKGPPDSEYQPIAFAEASDHACAPEEHMLRCGVCALGASSPQEVMLVPLCSADARQCVRVYRLLQLHVR